MATRYRPKKVASKNMSTDPLNDPLDDIFGKLDLSDLQSQPQPQPLQQSQPVGGAIRGAPEVQPAERWGSNRKAPGSQMEGDQKMRGRLYTAQAVKLFALAGNAIITIVSQKTGVRFTYRINQCVDDRGTTKQRKELWFVALLSGPDNADDYRYMGTIAYAGAYKHGVKSRIGSDAPSVTAFRWFWDHITRGSLPDGISVWHEGSCGRCGRKLTVPSSVMTGFGPECVKHIK